MHYGEQSTTPSYGGLRGRVRFTAIWLGRMLLIALGALILLISACAFLEYVISSNKVPDQLMYGIAIWAFIGIFVVRFGLAMETSHRPVSRPHNVPKRKGDPKIGSDNKVEDMVLFCARCGSQLSIDHNYCSLCGTERQIDGTNDHPDCESVHETNPEITSSNVDIATDSQVNIADSDKDIAPLFQRTWLDTLMICATTALVLSDQGMRVLFGDFYFVLLLVFTGDLLLGLISRATRKINARILD